MKKILFLCLICLFCSGCTKTVYTININRDNSVNFETSILLKSALLQQAGAENAEKEFKKSMSKDFISKKFTIDDYKDSEYTGIKAKKDFKTPSEFKIDNLPEGFSAKQNNVISMRKGIIKTKYKIDLQFDPTRANNSYQPEFLGDSKNETTSQNFTFSSSSNEFSNNSTNFENMSSNNISGENNLTNKSENNIGTSGVKEVVTYEDGAKVTTRYNMGNMEAANSIGGLVSQFQMTPVSIFTVKIPAKPTLHNATNVTKDGEYQWNLVQEKPVKIKIEYEKLNFANIVIGALSIIGIIALFAYRIII